jgi:membrane protease YdiL (CAAX protease family)
MFGLVHWDPRALVQTNLFLVLTMVLVGTGLAFIYERRGALLASISAHATFNIIGLVFILRGR